MSLRSSLRSALRALETRLPGSYDSSPAEAETGSPEDQVAGGAPPRTQAQGSGESQMRVTNSTKLAASQPSRQEVTVLCVGRCDHELAVLDREPDPAEGRGAIRREVRHTGD